MEVVLGRHEDGPGGNSEGGVTNEGLDEGLESGEKVMMKVRSQQPPME